MKKELGIPLGMERVAIPADAGDLPVPHFIDCFIHDAEDRAEAYGNQPGKGLFIPGDYRYAFQVIQWLLRSETVAKGVSFLEWGSGQGMVAILASLLGLKASGVEIDEKLVWESRELAARYDTLVEFEHGSYDPDSEDLEVVTAEGRDMVYVYPWPGEEAFFLQLFAGTAPAGALLMMCFGPEDIRLYQKKGD